jgi:type I restriction enzyme, S subunit
MSHYKPYPAYKDSGVEWIGRVPEHWEVKRLRHIATFANSNVDKKSYGGQQSVKLCNYTDVYYNEFITTSMSFMEATASDSEISAFSLKKGDVLITKDSEDPSDIGIPALVSEDMPGVICGYHLTMIRSHDPDTAGFAHRSIQSHPTKAHFFVESPGITRYGLDQDAIGDIRLCIPTAAERTRIAEWINRETTRIDALIAKKARFIELLKEKRQALITHAVTKGLDRGVTMKDSGVEWIGEVPEHWAKAQLGKLSLSRCDGPFGSGLKSDHYTESGVRVVRLQNIGWAEFKGSDAAYIAPEYWRNELNSGHAVISGDVLIAGLGDESNPLGRACVAPSELGEAMVKADCYRFRIGGRAIPDYVALTLSATARAECGFLATGATRDRLNLTLASARVIPLPPIEEQREILRFIRVQVSRLDLLTKKTKRSITLLKERRSALITAAVTGQIDLQGTTS